MGTQTVILTLHLEGAGDASTPFSADTVVVDDQATITIHGDLSGAADAERPAPTTRRARRG
jgi:hypothetical protein